MTIDPHAVAAFEAIHAGDVQRLERLLFDHPALATTRFSDERGHERTLHWAASSDDVEVLDALVAAGADIDAPGSVIDGSGPPDEVTNAFWCACHGGQREAAERLLEAGAELNWLGHDALTPLGAAERSDAAELAAWLRSRGAH